MMTEFRQLLADVMVKLATTLFVKFTTALLVDVQEKLEVESRVTVNNPLAL